MRVILLLWVVALAACDEGDSRVRGVTCATNFECTVAGALGSCQPNGFCAYPDATCAGGQRYSPGATGVESQCIGGGMCGGEDEACCGAMCDQGLACNANTTCTCGDGDGAPCCDGMWCGANLVCGDAATCACGGPGEPCCGGDTCDGGATCAAGTCPTTYDQIALGNHFICGLRTDRVVQCWGQDRFTYSRGTPAQAINVLESLTPRVVANATSVAELQAGEGHACVRKTDGTLWCWGQGSHGQLGNGAMNGSPAAVQVSGLTAVTAFSVGRHHTCAIGTHAGAAGVYCWGHASRGSHDPNATPSGDSRLGNNSTIDSATPVAVVMTEMAAAGQTARLVLAGGYHSCAVMSDERVWCWGSNDAGNLGTGDVSSSLVPRLVDLSLLTIPSGVTIAQIDAGSGYRSASNTCMRLSNGTVYCWGPNDYGQLGNGSAGDTSRPETAVSTTLLGGATFSTIATAGQATCALDSTAKVWCWGRGKAGQLGNDNDLDESEPVAVLGLPATVTTVASGHRTSCALDPAKHLWCWGNNRRGIITRSIPATADEAKIDQAVEVKP